MAGFVPTAGAAATRRGVACCAAHSRREVLIGLVGVGLALGGRATVRAEELVAPKTVEYYGIALDCVEEVRELKFLVRDEQYEELRRRLRGDPLSQVRRSLSYLANYSLPAGDGRRKAVEAYKKMIASVEKLDNQALLASRGQSKADIAELLANVATNLDDLMAMLPNPLK